MKRWTLVLGVLACGLTLTTGSVLADTFDGTPGDDRLLGTESNDFIRGRGGNDELFGRGGADRIIGEAGADIVNGQLGNDSLDGGLGPDEIVAGPGVDRLFGQGGNDVLRSVGDEERDFVNCGSGEDTAFVSANDVVDGAVAGVIVSTLGLTCETLFVDGRRIPSTPAT